MREAIARHAGRPLREIVDAVIDSQLEAHREHPLEWGAHYLLERHLSGPDAYRKMYDRFADEWANALDAAADFSPGCPKEGVARASRTIMYGLFAHAHIGASGEPDLELLARQVRTAIHAYLEALRRAPSSGLGAKFGIVPDHHQAQ